MEPADTARWIAYFRALESKRPDALFRDPFAQRLAGAAGATMAHELGGVDIISRAIAVRTATFDQLITELVATRFIGQVLNLAAGLDTRPWRLNLPVHLHWVDVDLPGLLAYKATILGCARPQCQYRAIAADLTDSSSRQQLLVEVTRDERVTLVVTEGFLVYLSPSQVASLTQDLRKPPAIQWWLTDLVGPPALAILQQAWGSILGSEQIDSRQATFQFAPADSSEFFRSVGWQEHQYYAAREQARQFKRPMPLPWLAKWMLWCGTAARREAFRRISGTAVLKVNA